jgi:hypothetical protein
LPREAASFGAGPLPPPPLTVGDARTGADDDDDDYAAMFPAAPPVVTRDPAPPRPTAPAAPPRGAAPSEPAPAAPAGGASPDLELVRRKWRLINEELKRDKKAHVQAILADTEPEAFEQDTLVLRFPYQTMADIFAGKRSKEFGDALTQAIQRVTGIVCKVRPQTGGPPTGKPVGGATPTRPSPAAPARASAPQAAPPQAAPPAAATPAPAAPARSTRPGPPAPPPSGGGDLTHDVLEIFDGRIVDGAD